MGPHQTKTAKISSTLKYVSKRTTSFIQLLFYIHAGCQWQPTAFALKLLSYFLPQFWLEHSMALKVASILLVPSHIWLLSVLSVDNISSFCALNCGPTHREKGSCEFHILRCYLWFNGRNFGSCCRAFVARQCKLWIDVRFCILHKKWIWSKIYKLQERKKQIITLCIDQGLNIVAISVVVASNHLGIIAIFKYFFKENIDLFRFSKFNYYYFYKISIYSHASFIKKIIICITFLLLT